MSNSPVQVSSSATAPSKIVNVFLWTLQILAAAMFLVAGGSKLAGAPPMVALFAKIGIGQWFRYVTGGIEVASAVLLLIPRISAVGGFLLACTMIGAIITHVFVVGGNPGVPIVLLLITATIAWQRQKLLLG